MNVHLPAPRHGWPARLANLAVVIVVLALAAATFVLSYTGVHVIALQAGVSPRLARIYPGVFDAVLVIGCAAAVMLRYARWWARCYAWLTIIVVIGVVGAADAVHAMNIALPHRQTEGVVAAAPWVLVLLGFSLMLTMLGQPRGQHATATPVEPPAGLAGRPVVPALPPSADAHPPTLVAPVFTESEEPTAAPEADAEHGDPSARDDEGAELEMPAAQDATETGEASREDETTAPLRYSGAPEPPDWPAGHATNIYAAPHAGPVAGWLERVADSGDPETERHDYWETDVPRLNRVRATPIPPEPEEEDE